MTILSEVKALGQQIWLDNLSRSLIQSGELTTLMQQGVCGVTSNPAIFQKAFSGDELYRQDIDRLKQQDLSPKQRYETLAIADVQAACDILLAEYEASGQRSGFVSLEVTPDLAKNTEGTITEAKRLYAAIDRKNVMIKVPATDAGIAALQQLVTEGISINLTLLFSRQQTLKAYKSYSAAIRNRLASGQAVNNIHVVASFFISRIDNALDSELPASLKGKTAISLAKAAYQDWQTFFSDHTFTELSKQGANPVQLLWASTGVKNPDYSDILYIDSLIGDQTVSTIPDSTLKAFIDHGTARNTLTEQVEEAFANLEEIKALGIDLETVANRLQEDGLKQFEDAFKKLLQPLS